VGQHKAKRAVAVALRNRWRRQRCAEPLREEILPFNIILIGPTGVGKTEIARRLAALVDAPFVKVEASRFTEVGYVGRDVESMVRDLVDLAVQRERALEMRRLEEQAADRVRERLLELLAEHGPDSVPIHPGEVSPNGLARRLDEGELEELPLVLEVEESQSSSMMQVFSPGGMEEIAANIQEFLGDMVQRQTRRKQLSVAEARRQLLGEECARLLDQEAVVARALDKCENQGIVFIDEIDKVCSPHESHGPDVSRQGVQKDILPVIEGTSVHTKYGMVRTDHMLFIASGAFHLSRPADLIPELQGRFPVRVELDSLGRRDFERILTRPENALVRQYEALFAAEGVELVFRKEAVREVAEFAQLANRRAENIGARRLQGMMSLLLEEELFRLPDRRIKRVEVKARLVRERLGEAVEDEDLSRYVL